MGSVSHCIRHVKICKKTDFQVHGKSSFLFVKGNPLEEWGRVPHSKNSPGDFLSGFCFIVFSRPKCVRRVSFKRITQIVFYL